MNDDMDKCFLKKVTDSVVIPVFVLTGVIVDNTIIQIGITSYEPCMK